MTVEGNNAPEVTSWDYKIVPADMGDYEKNFCPNCGSRYLNVRNVPVYGSTGYIVVATCKSCGCKF